MPGDRNFVSFSFESGLHYRGVIPGRDEDALGLGIDVIWISEDVRRAVDRTNRADRTAESRPDFEATIELVDRYQAAPWLSIRRTHSMSFSLAARTITITR